jgi:predicted nucleic acid-binding protein
LHIPLSALVVEEAIKLMDKHPLKGADAIHLAAAKLLFRFRKLHFCTLDRQLYELAKLYVPVIVVPEFER